MSSREDADSAADIRDGAGKRARVWIWRAVQIALIAAVTWGVIRTVGPELGRMTWADVRELRPSLSRLAISTVLLLVVYLGHAFLWRAIMVDLDVGKPSARDTVQVYFLASLGRYLPGKFWQLAGLAVLAARAGLSPGGAAASAVLGQVAFLTTGLIFLAVLLPRFVEGSAAFIAAAVLGLAGLGGWALLGTRRGHAIQHAVISRLPEGFQPRLRGAFALGARIRGRAAVGWAAGYGLTWVALGAAFALFVSAFVPSALSALRHLAGTIAASYLWGYVMVIAPAGLGVRELAMSGLLAQIPGFPAVAAVVVPVASRLWFTLAELVPLAIIPALPHRHAASEGNEGLAEESDASDIGAP